MSGVTTWKLSFEAFELFRAHVFLKADVAEGGVAPRREDAPGVLRHARLERRASKDELLERVKAAGRHLAAFFTLHRRLQRGNLTKVTSHYQADAAKRVGVAAKNLQTAVDERKQRCIDEGNPARRPRRSKEQPPPDARRGATHTPS